MNKIQRIRFYKVIYICFFIIIYSSNELKSSNPYWLYTLEKTKSVTSMVGDSNFMWLCINEYLNPPFTYKFDVRSMQIIDSLSIDGDIVKLDNKNNIWVADYKEFGKFDGKKLEIWDTSRFTQIGIPNLRYSNITSFHVDNKNNVWIGTGTLGLALFDGNTCTVFDAENSGLPKTSSGTIRTRLISDIENDKDNNLWVVFSGGGLGKYNGEIWKFYNTGNSGLPTYKINKILCDKLGNLWLATTDGLVKYENDNWTIYNKENTGLSSEDFRHICKDKDNHVWASLLDVGLVKFDGNEFTIFNKDNSGLSSNKINNLYIDVYNNKWISVGKDNQDYSLNIFNEDGIIITSVESNNNQLIYPNPASDYVTISIPELNKGLQTLIQKVQIFNIFGVEVISTPASPGEENLRIDVSHLPAGVYYVRIGSMIEMFVKM